MSTQTSRKSHPRRATRRSRSHPARRAKAAHPPQPPRRPRARRAEGMNGHQAAHELELFVAVLKKCKRAVGGFSDEQKKRLRGIMARAHRAIDRLHT